MSARIRHVLPNLGHFAAYCYKGEPYGQLLPLVDRVLITREVNGETRDMIVGTVISDTTYRIADEVRDEKTTKFMGYVDPVWLQAKGTNLIAYEEQMKTYGRTWEQRTTPVVIPAAIEELFDEVFEDEEEETTPPPRKRQGKR